MQITLFIIKTGPPIFLGDHKKRIFYFAAFVGSRIKQSSIKNSNFTCVILLILLFIDIESTGMFNSYLEGVIYIPQYNIYNIYFLLKKSFEDTRYCFGVMPMFFLNKCEK